MQVKHHLAFSPLYLAMFGLAEPAVHAQNFTITVVGTPATSVTQGQSISWNYTVTNKTHDRRDGYVVTGLPSTVTQDGSGGNCSNPISLAANAACNLKLDITGAVHTNFAICHGTSCTSAASPINVDVNTVSTSPFIAAGVYGVSGGKFPLLAQSLNAGQTWQYPVSSQSPILTSTPTTDTLGFLGVSCAGGNCIAVGEEQVDSTYYLLLASGSQTTTTWQYDLDSNTQPELTGVVYLGKFTSASCNSDTCIAVGEYVTNSNQYQIPLVAQRLNNIWSYPIQKDSSGLPDNFNAGGAGIGSQTNKFYSASCSASLCAAAGNYIAAEGDNPSYPYIALATAANNWTWNSVVDSTEINDLTNNDFSTQGKIASTSCVDTTCFAAGDYNSASHGSQSWPFLINTTDSGASWSPIINGTTTTPTAPTGILTGFFKSVNYHDNIAIAGGSYGTNAATFPLLAQMSQGGAWQYAIERSTPPLPSNYSNSGIFNSVACSDSLCVAVGNYSANLVGGGNFQVPLIAQAKILDGVIGTWSYVVQNDSSSLPTDYDGSTINGGGELNSVSCNGTVCTAAGVYYINSLAYPLFMQTTDGGATWSSTISKTVGSLPNDLVNGQFNATDLTSTTSGLASSLPQSLQMLYGKK